MFPENLLVLPIRVCVFILKKKKQRFSWAVQFSHVHTGTESEIRMKI